jgi:hypothetical protein
MEKTIDDNDIKYKYWYCPCKIFTKDKGVGMTEIWRKEPEDLNEYEKVKNIKDFIKNNDSNIKSVYVLNWIEVSKDAYEAAAKRYHNESSN